MLALKQAKEIAGNFPEIDFEIVAIATKGDKDKKTPLTLQERSDFFTYEIEQALINQEIDLAVHSAKDLEENQPEELEIIALTESIDPADCLVAKRNYDLDSLPAGSRVGTSSRNRSQGILNYRRDLLVKDIRGNVDQRINQLRKGSFEAIVVAAAALIRLKREYLISQVIPFTVIQPHPLQGRLAIQIRNQRSDLRSIFRNIDSRG